MNNLFFKEVPNCHQSLRGVNADILSIGYPKEWQPTEHQEMGDRRLNELEWAGKKTQKENLETDTGIMYKLENIDYLLHEEAGIRSGQQLEYSVISTFVVYWRWSCWTNVVWSFVEFFHTVLKLCPTKSWAIFIYHEDALHRFCNSSKIQVLAYSKLTVSQQPTTIILALYSKFLIRFLQFLSLQLWTVWMAVWKSEVRWSFVATDFNSKSAPNKEQRACQKYQLRDLESGQAAAGCVYGVLS